MPSPPFQNAIARANHATPPVWMMRQAGRYHSHYQLLKKKYSFEELCKTPALAAETAMGPIRDFDFDAAILFSDILYPLELLGNTLAFMPGPKLGFHLESIADLSKYSLSYDISGLEFQREALRLTRDALPNDKSLIAFVGSPLTLYVFAVHGTHKTDLTDARNGLRDGRFDGMMKRIVPLLVDNMSLQASAGPDAVAVFDSCAGDITLNDFETLYLPFLEILLREFKSRHPDMPVIYYGQNIGASHWDILQRLPFEILGVDHRQDIDTAFVGQSHRFAIQGNFNPDCLTLGEDECAEKIAQYFDSVQALPKALRKGWIAGLGHGVTPHAKEANVRQFITALRALAW